MSESQKRRIVWLDAAKGLAIILVVVAHVLGGLMAAGLFEPAQMGAWVYQWIYCYHMPVFFCASGILASRDLRMTLVACIRKHAEGLLYPYFVWGIITWLFHLCGDAIGATNTHAGLWLPFQLPYNAEAGPWFLYVLFVFHILYRCANIFKRGAEIFLLLAFTAHLLAQHFSSQISDLPTVPALLNHSVFFALGAVCSRWILVWISAHSGHRMLLLGMMCLVLMTLLLDWKPPIEGLPTLVRALLGIAGTFALARVLSDSVLGIWAGGLGVSSLVIYLLHGFLPPLMRYLLVSRLHIHQGSLLLAAGSVAGFLLPLIFIRLRKHMSLDFLLRSPTSAREETQSTAGSVP